MPTRFMYPTTTLHSSDNERKTRIIAHIVLLDLATLLCPETALCAQKMIFGKSDATPTPTLSKAIAQILLPCFLHEP